MTGGVEAAPRVVPRRWPVARGAVPVLLGLVVVAIGVAHPGGPVRGSVASGPVGAPVAANAAVRSTVTVRWSSDHRRIVMDLRSWSDCPTSDAFTTSTAPARVEVSVAVATGTCYGFPVVRRYLLPPPVIAESGQPVTVLVDRQHFALHRYVRPSGRGTGQGTVQ